MAGKRLESSIVHRVRGNVHPVLLLGYRSVTKAAQCLDNPLTRKRQSLNLVAKNNC